jgi:hypothetical protein
LAFEWVAPAEAPSDQELHKNGKRLAAIRKIGLGETYRLIYPSIYPNPPIEPLQAAKHRAECVALWSLPSSMPRQPASPFSGDPHGKI